MLRWGEFALTRPLLAARGRELFYDFGGIGLGFLATVRPDGGPRVHPICPVLNDEGLYGFIVPGPKLADLHRDLRYSLHSETFPPPRQDDAFVVTGSATWVHDAAVRERLAQQVLAERDLERHWPGFEQEQLVEFRLERCLLTLTQGDADFPAGHTIWRARPM